MRTKVKYVPRGLHTPLSPLPLYLIRTSHFCPDCRNPGREKEGGVGDTELRRVLPPAFATAYFREKDNGRCTTGEKAVMCFLLHQSSSLPIRLAGQVCKRQCCNSLTVRADDMSANPPSSDRKAVVLRIMRLSRTKR